MNITTSFLTKNIYIALVVLGTSFVGNQAHALNELDQVIQQLQPAEEALAAEFDPETGKKAKIIIAGDSWAMFPCLFGSMRKMLREENFPIVSDKRCFLTSQMGIQADEWLGSDFDRRLTRYLTNDSRIKYVYLSLGGNDLMGYWNTELSAEEELKVYQKTYDTIEKIVKKYTKLRPDVKIILSGYDYGRLTDHNLLSLYTTIYNRMKKPTPAQVNAQLIKFSQFMNPLADRKNIYFIHHLGLSHYYDGVKGENLACETTMNPNEISSWENPLSVGGRQDLPACTSSMINWLNLSEDAIHLSSKNYYWVMKHTYNNLLKHIINQPIEQASQTRN